MGRFNLSTRLAAAFAAVIVLFAAALWVALGGLRDVGHRFGAFLDGDYARQTAYQQMFAEGLLSGVALRNLVLKPHLKKPYQVVPQAIARFDAAYARARELAPDDATRAALKQIGHHWQQTRAAKLKVLDLMKAGEREAALTVLTRQEHPHWQKVRIAVQKLSREEETAAAAAGRAALESEQSALALALALALVAVAGGAVVAWVATRGLRRAFARIIRSLDEVASGDGDLTRRLPEHGRDETARVAGAFNRFVEKIHGVVQEVGEAGTRLAESSKQMSELAVDTKLNVNQQESKIEQVAAAMNQMAATVQEVARHAREASEAAQSADRESADGRRVVSEVVDAIHRLADQVGTAARTIHSLEENAEAIGTVLDVIRGIAEQTNLLALNAAIEAARAGEQGRGFAVVADEVRTLASRTQQSTEEIQETIERLQAGAKAAVAAMEEGRTQTEHTVEKAGRAGEALAAITAAVSRIAEMNTQIASAANEQSSVAEEINQNVVSINTLSVQAAQGAEHVAATAQDVERLAEELRRLVGSFRV